MELDKFGRIFLDPMERLRGERRGRGKKERGAISPRCTMWAMRSDGSLTFTFSIILFMAQRMCDGK
jgi:hypothetical protein